jgi:hypothetical protein
MFYSGIERSAARPLGVFAILRGHSTIMHHWLFNPHFLTVISLSACLCTVGGRHPTIGLTHRQKSQINLMRS